MQASALEKSTEMAQLAMGKPNKLVAKGELMKTIERISTPLPRPYGLMMPRQTPPAKKGRKGEGLAGRDSPLPVWTWSVHNVGADGLPQPRFVT